MDSRGLPATFPEGFIAMTKTFSPAAGQRCLFSPHATPTALGKAVDPIDKHLQWKAPVVGAP